MKKLMNLLMLSCKMASELIDKKSLFKLSITEKVMLRMHTGMCGACTAYEKQSMLLDKLLHRHIHNADGSAITIIENNDLKEKIILKL